MTPEWKSGFEAAVIWIASFPEPIQSAQELARIGGRELRRLHSLNLTDQQCVNDIIRQVIDGKGPDSANAAQDQPKKTAEGSAKP